MNDKLNEYVDGVFAPYEGTKSVSDSSDLQGSDFAGVTVRDGRFETSALRGATLRDVSFRASSRKLRNVIRTVNFDGARMDKLTYAGLKALGAELSAVTVG